MRRTRRNSSSALARASASACARASASARSLDSASDRTLSLRVSELVSFGQDAAGHVYAVSLSGPVYRIDAG